MFVIDALPLQTIPPTNEDKGPHLATAHGFSLHAGVACTPADRGILERLTRYISRPALAESRLTPTGNGYLRYTMKTPWKDGTTHVVLHPLDFLARLASLVPRPRANLTRYHGIFAPHARERSLITPTGRRARATLAAAEEPKTPAERRQALTWAQRLKRVFQIDVTTCEHTWTPLFAKHFFWL